MDEYLVELKAGVVEETECVTEDEVTFPYGGTIVDVYVPAFAEVEASSDVVLNALKPD